MDSSSSSTEQQKQRAGGRSGHGIFGGEAERNETEDIYCEQIVRTGCGVPGDRPSEGSSLWFNGYPSFYR